MTIEHFLLNFFGGSKKDQMIKIFTFLIVTNFKTDRYLNNFQEHLFGILNTEKILHVTSKFFSHVQTRLLNMVEFKVQCLKVFGYHGNKSAILLFY